MMHQAILFDLGGTLVDTVPTWIQANIHVLEQYGVTMSEEKFLQDIYHAGLHHAGVLEHLGIDGDSEQFYELRDQKHEELIIRDSDWIGQTQEVLQQCSDAAPLGLLTGSKRRYIDALDTKLPVSKLFGAIITYDETGQRMKPDPYGLELLTKELDVEPSGCIYIGDQHVDVDVAAAIGMKSCLLKTEHTPPGAEEGADAVITDITELPRVLGL